MAVAWPKVGVDLLLLPLSLLVAKHLGVPVPVVPVGVHLLLQLVQCRAPLRLVLDLELTQLGEVLPAGLLLLELLDLLEQPLAAVDAVLTRLPRKLRQRDSRSGRATTERRRNF